MSKKTILRYILLASSLLLICPLAHAQEYETRELAALAQRHQRDTLFRGMAVSGDLVGLVMKPLGMDYGSFEGAARINLRNRFFPIGEVGYGFADYADEDTRIHFKTQAPYFRVGVDYNFLKNKNTGNRVFGGVRYAFSAFKYDMSDPNSKDPVWGTSEPFDFQGVKCTAHWAEFVFGVEAKIWKIFHLGWSARFKVRVHESNNEHGQPWYIPGYGKNGNTRWGGTFNLIFDV